MNTGFLEFGLPALIGFGFLNALAVWTFITDPPPGLEAARLELKKREESISTDGVKLVAPRIKEEVFVGV
jgi:hypothetical protein